MNQILNLTDQEKRYVVGWDVLEGNRERVFLWDKLSKRIVYCRNGKSRKDAYPYIQKHYGKENCVAPKQMPMNYYL